jgi:hypothetical protein
MRWTALQPRGSPLKGWARPVTRQLLVGGVVALQPASAARAAATRPTVGFLRCSAPPGGFIEAFELGLAPRPGPYQSGLVTSLSQGGGNISRNSEIPADHAETPRTAPGTHAPALPPVIMRSPRGLCARAAVRAPRASPHPAAGRPFHGPPGPTRRARAQEPAAGDLWFPGAGGRGRTNVLRRELTGPVSPPDQVIDDRRPPLWPGPQRRDGAPTTSNPSPA